MIYCIIGKKNKAFDTTLQKVVSACGKNNLPEKIIFSGNTEASFLEVVHSADLFGTPKTFIISIDDSLEESKKKLIDLLPSLTAPAYPMIIIFESLLAAELKKVEPYAEIHKVTAVSEKKEPFNPFGLANAFATGDKKKTWIAFQELLHHEDEMEKTHGMIWWKLKDMMMKKSIGSSVDLSDTARQLVAVYHESRKGGMNLQQRLEYFFLNLPKVK